MKVEKISTIVKPTKERKPGHAAAREAKEERCLILKFDAQGQREGRIRVHCEIEAPQGGTVGHEGVSIDTLGNS